MIVWSSAFRMTVRSFFCFARKSPVLLCRKSLQRRCSVGGAIVVAALAEPSSSGVCPSPCSRQPTLTAGQPTLKRGWSTITRASHRDEFQVALAAELGALTWQAVTAPAHGLLSADNKGSVELAGIHFATARRDRAPAALLVPSLLRTRTGSCAMKSRMHRTRGPHTGHSFLPAPRFRSTIPMTSPAETMPLATTTAMTARFTAAGPLLVRVTARRNPGSKRSIFTQGERSPVIWMRARDPSSSTAPASRPAKSTCRVVMFSPRSPAATLNPSALSSRKSSSSTR